MSKRKNLKRIINEVGANLLVELLAVKFNNPSIPDADVENVAASILQMQDDFISRLSHVDKHQVKRFFKQLEDDFAVSTNEIIDHIFHLA